MIYSQGYLMKQGLGVTWDNPDIQLYLGGVAVSSHALQPGTEYEIRARCWNASYDAPVVGMPVRFSYLSFGAGGASNFIGLASVSLGVIGGSDNPNYASVLWKTPAAAGHYCIQVKLEWNDDINPENNLGQENTNVVEVSSPAIFEFQVRNSEAQAHRYHLETDAYTIPPMLDCAELRKLGARKAEVIRARNSRGNHPVPPGWAIEAVPALFGLAPAEEKTVKVTVTPPDDFVGEQPINFDVFDERQVLVGGVTVRGCEKNAGSTDALQTIHSLHSDGGFRPVQPAAGYGRGVGGGIVAMIVALFVAAAVPVAGICSSSPAVAFSSPQSSRPSSICSVGS